MEGLSRKPFQGIAHIIRFNWHYYVAACILTGLGLAVISYLSCPLRVAAATIVVLLVLSIVVSVGISWYIYDGSGLYRFIWLDQLGIQPRQKLVNVHAGFDETSEIFSKKYPASELSVLDFYDPEKHTEISIRRARKAYPSFPGTQKININEWSPQGRPADFIFLIFAAHEIRDPAERILFFKKLRGFLSEEGRIVVLEHQRDMYNFIAYNFGFFHFLSGKSWKKTFAKAGLYAVSEFKINPFIKTFILKSNGAAN
jgi:hypothetical protein